MLVTGAAGLVGQTVAAGVAAEGHAGRAHDIRPVYVFDGRAPVAKAAEVERRRQERHKATEAMGEARAAAQLTQSRGLCSMGADPLGAAEFLGERPLDWGGQVWTAETVDATPDSLAVAADGWCGPQEFCDRIPWSEYPSRFGELALPPSDPSALTSIEWPGSGASPEAVAAPTGVTRECSVGRPCAAALAARGRGGTGW